MPDKTILFADDSATMRTIVEKTFLAEPYDVVAVPSGEAAIAKARELKPNIVIVDGGLIGVSGYDVCKAMRGDASLSGTPVIIMSGVSNPYDEAQGKAVGANDHVKKPFDTTKLIELVGELTAGAAAPAPKVAKPVAAAPQPAPAQPAAVPAPRLSRPVPAVPQPVPTAPQPAPAPAPAPVERFDEISEPIELVEPEPIEDIPIEDEVIEEEETQDGDAFQVSTLAEMAQMDDQGGQVQPDTNSTEVALTPDVEAPKKDPAKQLPIEEAIQEQALAAAETVAKEVAGVAPEQLETIQKLTAEVIEKVVWEVVPELAETIIKEEIAKLLEE